MNQKAIFILFIIVIALSVLTFTGNQTAEAPETTIDETEKTAVSESVVVYPVSHASFVMRVNDIVVVNDPVGDSSAYLQYGTPGIVLVSDIHGDHLSVEALEAVMAVGEPKLIVPQAVFDELSESLKAQAIVLNNGDNVDISGLLIEAIPMYNLPMEGPEYRHVKGRGNGYVLSTADTNIYIAGDTEDIPEMRALTDIDIAFIPMNLPYTMGVEQAADGVATFAPKVVYPYHYRGTDGLGDVEEFKRLVNEEDADIEVRLLDWYPSAE